MASILIVVSAITQVLTAVEYMEMSRQLVDSVRAFAEADGPKELGGGPLFLDLDSFIEVGHEVTGEKVGAARLREAIGNQFEDRRERDAVHCASEGYPCHVLDNGLLVQLDKMLERQSRMVAYVNLVTNHRSVTGSRTICPQLLRVVFTRLRGAWSLVYLTPMETC